MGQRVGGAPSPERGAGGASLTDKEVELGGQCWPPMTGSRQWWGKACRFMTFSLRYFPALSFPQASSSLCMSCRSSSLNGNSIRTADFSVLFTSRFHMELLS